MGTVSVKAMKNCGSKCGNQLVMTPVSKGQLSFVIMESSSSDDFSASENHSMYSYDSDLESMTELSLMSSSDISSESLGTDLQSDVENHSVGLDSCWSDDESVLELFPNDSDESESCTEDFEEPVVGLADNQDGTPLFSGGSITMLQSLLLILQFALR